jgi:outer membrane protein assembly factor BamB
MTCSRIAGRIVAAGVLCAASGAGGQEWTRFRGPNGRGISHAKTIPVRWTQREVNWRVELAGGGESSPVVWGEKVFVTCDHRRLGSRMLAARRASDGKLLWRKQYPPVRYSLHGRNSYAAATPAVDANHVYALWTTPQKTRLVALGHDGAEVWQGTFPGVHCPHGAATSPIVVDDMVIFTREHESQGPDPSSWVAVDRETGKKRWELPRETCIKTAYSTPCLFAPKGRPPRLIFTSLAHGMTAVDPQTGKVQWELKSVFRWRVVASPVLADGLLIGSSGQNYVAVRPPATASGKPTVARGKGPYSYCPTPLAKDGLLFVFRDDGRVYCLRGATGEQVWEAKPGGRFGGSPVWVDGRLYCITMDGKVVVIRAAEKYELLAVNPLGEKSQATPAVAGGRMYLRTWTHLICVGGKAAAASPSSQPSPGG